MICHLRYTDCIDDDHIASWTDETRSVIEGLPPRSHIDGVTSRI